jgi:hypothetical protein
MLSGDATGGIDPACQSRRWKCDDIHLHTVQFDEVDRRNDAMSRAKAIYCFALQTDGVQIEELGAMALCDDVEAVAFGERVARDLANGLEQQPGTSIAVKRRTRTVRSIPVK